MTEQAHEWVVINTQELEHVLSVTAYMNVPGGRIYKTECATLTDTVALACALVFVPAEGKEPTP